MNSKVRTPLGRSGIAAITLTLLVVSSLHVQTAYIANGPSVSLSAEAMFSTRLGAYQEVQHPLPNGSKEPWGIATDSAGNVWFVEQSSNQVGEYSPTKSTFSEYAIPTSDASPEELTIDGSGNVWITELQPSALGELSHGASVIKEFRIPKAPSSLQCGPIGVASDRSGHVWVTCEFSNQIDEFFPTNGTFLQYDMPVFFSAPLSIVFDSSGNFWFTAADSNMLGYVTVPNLRNGTSDGIDEFAPVNQTYPYTFTSPTNFQGQGSTQYVSSLSTPGQLALSPNGKSLWITEHSASSFDRFDISSRSLIKYWTSQTLSSSYRNTLPNGIAIDDSGNVWIAEHYGNRIAEFDPSAEELTEYPIPCCGTGIAASLYLAVGRNNTVWFSEFNGNTIGELKPLPRDDNFLNFSVSNGTVTLGPKSVANLSISLSTNGSPLTARMILSGISNTGALENASATFFPSALSVPSHRSASTELSLKTEGLHAGQYYLTVGAEVSPSDTIYSFIVKLNVSMGAEEWQSLIVYGAVLGVLSSIGVVAAMAYWRKRKTKYKISLISRRRNRRRAH